MFILQCPHFGVFLTIVVACHFSKRIIIDVQFFLSIQKSYLLLLGGGVQGGGAWHEFTKHNSYFTNLKAKSSQKYKKTKMSNAVMT